MSERAIASKWPGDRISGSTPGDKMRAAATQQDLPCANCAHLSSSHLSGYTCQINKCWCLDYKPYKPAAAATDKATAAADICAEMAREAATNAARHLATWRETGYEQDGEAINKYEAQANALREAERRIRAALATDKG